MLGPLLNPQMEGIKQVDVLSKLQSQRGFPMTRKVLANPAPDHGTMTVSIHRSAEKLCVVPRTLQAYFLVLDDLPHHVQCRYQPEAQIIHRDCPFGSRCPRDSSRDSYACVCNGLVLQEDEESKSESQLLERFLLVWM